MDWLREQWGHLAGHESLLAWIGGASVATLVVSFFAVPLLIRRLPHDYFLEDRDQSTSMRKRHPVIRLLVLVLKNLLGVILVVGGFIMFFIPGQGLITLVIGLLLLNFPGKRKLEIWLIRRKPIKRAVDWIRERAGRDPLALPEG